MAGHSRFFIRFLLLFLAVNSTGCSKLDDAVDTARTRIKNYLNTQGIYERDNVPETVQSNNIKGYYDIIDGAYRWIIDEDKVDRLSKREIGIGDSISFNFDARIFSSTFDNSTTYYTNIPARIAYLSNNNPQFDISRWPTEPLRIKVGSSDSILKAIHSSLPSCRVGDEVRIFLPPDVAYGSKGVGLVPGSSTLVYQLTEIEIID